MTTEELIKQFIEQNFYVSDAAALTADTSLINGGYVDSTGMLEMVGFLEEQFSIQVSEQELVPENFETIARMVAYLDGKRARQAPVPG
jgi:acyl carrier protein